MRIVSLPANMISALPPWLMEVLAHPGNAK
jgi:hypothetical protein